MTARVRRAGLRITVGGIVAALVAAGCGADTGADRSPAGSVDRAETATPSTPESLPEPVQELVIDGTEYAFAITPDPAAGLRPGWTLVRFTNVGDEAHQVMFAGLKDGVDITELAAAGAGDSSGSAAIEFVDMLGGVSYIDPGHETVALVNLPPGIVPAMCYVPNADGEAHALLGMSTLLTVAASTEGSAAPPAGDEPYDLDGAEVVGTIELAADGYHVPEDLGPGWYHVVNTDVHPEDHALGLHELSLLRLGEPLEPDEIDALVEDLAANIAPTVELEALGGLGAVSAGFDAYLYLDLPPGDYLAVDFMPDPGDPRPHMLDGYVGSFTVPAD